MKRQIARRIKRLRQGAQAMSSAPASLPAVVTDREPISLWLYAAGLCVTLSGLYAVNYSVKDPGFATLSYGMATLGYLFSYVLRVRGIKLETIQAPLMVCVLLLALANISGGGVGWLVPESVRHDRALGLQLMVAWVAIIHTFLLVSDSSVLFACVPGMTLLALVSTLNPDPEIQNAFLVFIGAATFMMVHENFLRTRTVVSTARLPRRERRLITGQIQLTVACLVGALFLANIVAVPIRAVGQTLFDPVSINPLNEVIARTRQASTNNMQISENNTLELALGPTAESDLPIMRVQCDRGLYWRGTTYSEYTGIRFSNPSVPKQPVLGIRDVGQAEIENRKQFFDPTARDTTSPQQVYEIPVSRYDLPTSDMRGSQKTKQHFELIGGTFNSFYGAAAVRTVATLSPSLSTDAAGVLLGDVTVPSAYDIVSQVPTSDPEILKAASSSLRDVPQDIQEAYLQLPTDKNPDDNLSLQKLANDLTRGKASNYDKVEALRTYIVEHCKYNLQAPYGPRDRDIVAWFLFDKKEGYCDSFAAALTVLCRHAKIPARMATGFLSGDYEGNNTYLVRQKYKHLWTEVFFSHVGWVPFDATAGSIDISDHGSTSKHRFAGFSTWLTSHGILPPLLAGAFMLMLGYVFKTEVLERIRLRGVHATATPMRPQANQQIVDAYARVNILLAKRGLPRPLPETPDEYADNIARRTNVALPSLGLEYARLTALYTRFRYSRDIATRDDVQAAQSCANTIQVTLQTVKSRDLSNSV